ncbi:MAG TPA: hypothetical protein VG435_02585 [Acidimicrobiales bacterium]|jgi:hypothetical protein|nr:hypothetical protein [Acidimicrobiales bacterium]
MKTVEMAGRAINRVGLSAGDIKATGMWGEPADRKHAVAAIRNAVEMGVDVIEVMVPFGPSADLFREAAPRDVFVIARLTSELPDLDAVRYRLGRRPDLILVDEHRLEPVSTWGVPVGAIVGNRSSQCLFSPLRAVRGPYPALRRMVDWCEQAGVSYITNSTNILDAGERTIALLTPASLRDVERLFGATPPVAEPG